MKGSTNFLIGLAAALITFGTLTLAFGPRHVEWRGYNRQGFGAYHHAPDSCHKGYDHQRHIEPRERGDS